MVITTDELRALLRRDEDRDVHPQIYVIRRRGRLLRYRRYGISGLAAAASVVGVIAALILLGPTEQEVGGEPRPAGPASLIPTRAQEPTTDTAARLPFCGAEFCFGGDAQGPTGPVAGEPLGEVVNTGWTVTDLIDPVEPADVPMSVPPVPRGLSIVVFATEWPTQSADEKPPLIRLGYIHPETGDIISENAIGAPQKPATGQWPRDHANRRVIGGDQLPAHGVPLPMRWAANPDWQIYGWTYEKAVTRVIAKTADGRVIEGGFSSNEVLPDLTVFWLRGTVADWKDTASYTIEVHGTDGVLVTCQVSRCAAAG